MISRAGSVVPVRSWREARAFQRLPALLNRGDPWWISPLPGEERAALRSVRAARWLALGTGDRPAGRLAAFLPTGRPGTGYLGLFEAIDDPDVARPLFAAAEEWLAGQGCRSVFGPVFGSPRDRLGLLVEGFDAPPVLFTPYNQKHHQRLFEAAGYRVERRLRSYGWPASPTALVAGRYRTAGRLKIRTIDPGALRAETRIVCRLINETLEDVWHFDPIDEAQADELARLLKWVLDPEIALIAEDGEGPCGVALSLPDLNHLWHQAGGRLAPFVWLLTIRRPAIRRARMTALGLSRRVRGTNLAARLIGELDRRARSRGYTAAELGQVFDGSMMHEMLDRLELPVVRRYAIYRRDL